MCGYGPRGFLIRDNVRRGSLLSSRELCWTVTCTEVKEWRREKGLQMVDSNGLANKTVEAHGSLHMVNSNDLANETAEA